VVEKLKTEYQVEIEWRPYYLRPDTPPEGTELPAYVRSRMAATHERLKQMANGAGLEMVFPTRIVNTRLAHEATEYARSQGRHQEFHRVVFRLYYGEGQDISLWPVLRTAAQEAGLDPDEMQRQVENGQFTALVEQQVQEAQELGITGVPTYVVGEKYAIVGAQSYEIFQRAIARLEAEQGPRRDA
jgi:predicted DsbA family dithiol-disulfide isomerase